MAYFGLCTFVTLPAKGQLIVDEFLDNESTAAMSMSVFADDAILGGEREVDNSNNSSSVSNSEGQFIAVMDFFNSVRFVYDGTDGSVSEFMHEGLGGLDLAATSDAFLINGVLPLLSGVTIDIAFYTDANNASYVRRTVGTPLDPIDLIVPFTSFDVLLGEGVDFSNVGAIEIVVSSNGQTQVFIDGFGFNDTPLPVELSSFTALEDGGDVLLQWETASELNNAGFFVEHRTPNQPDFDEVDYVEGQGTTDVSQSYTYRLPVSTPGMHQFRLKQVDFDGTFEYSPVAHLTVEVGGKYQLTSAYPNPFNPQSTFSLVVQKNQHVRVVLHDILGRQVAILHDALLAGQMTHTFVIDGTGLPSGTYVYSVQGESFNASSTVLLVK